MAKETKPQKTSAGGTSESSAGDSAPSVEPVIEATGVKAMSDAMPNQQPPATGVSGAISTGADDAPTLTPGAAGVTAAAGVTTWLNNKRVSGLWGINQNRNSWVYVTGVGWKKLANNSDTAVVALTILAASAKQMQSVYNYREEADGMIHETYVW